MNARVPDGLTPAQAARYGVELVLMGWPPTMPNAPAPMHHAVYYAWQAGMALLAARDSWRVTV
jgi:hypothetical protein